VIASITARWKAISCARKARSNSALVLRRLLVGRRRRRDAELLRQVAPLLPHLLVIPGEHPAQLLHARVRGALGA
jgi:hypothetical protein